MSLPERYGRFVLLKELDFGSLGVDFRAVELTSEGKPYFSNLLRVSEALTRDDAVLKRLIAEAKASAQLNHPNVLKILGIGKVHDSYFLSYPVHEGQTLKSIFRKTRREAFPPAVDHALLIASKVARAIEYCHSRKFEGSRYFHGSLFPSSIFITYEGEVRIRGFAFWNALKEKARGPGYRGAEESLYLAPEQFERFAGDYRADLFTLGATLFEMLTGLPYFEKERAVDFPGRIMAARLQHPPGEGRPLPPGLVDLLRLILAPEPADRLPEVGEVRQRIEKILFTGEFQPTTFNLAFFMHSLFRKEIEEEAQTGKAERERDYRGFFPEHGKPAPTTEARRHETPVKVPAYPKTPVAEVSAADTLPEHGTLQTAIRAAVEAHVQTAAADSEPLPLVVPPAPAVAKSSPTGAAWVFAVVAIAAVVVGAAWLSVRYLGSGAIALTQSDTTASATLAAPAPPLDYPAEIKRIQEELLKAKETELAAERERLRREVQRELEGKQEGIIAAELKRREKELEDRIKRGQEEELKRREEEVAARVRREEGQRRQQEDQAGAAAKAEPAALDQAGLTPSSEPLEPPVPSVPAIVFGQLVSADDPLVVAPRPKKRVLPQYPPLAARQRIEAEVVVSALVSENGDVVDVRLVQSKRGNLGFDEAAIKAVMQYKFTPPMKSGVPVRVWFNVVVKFTN